MNKNRLRVVMCALAVVFVAVLAVGCGEESELTSEQLEAAMANIVDAQNRFGLELYRALTAAAPDESVVISPLSVHTALGMAYNGAQGATLSEMGRVMHLGAMSRAELNQAVRGLLEGFTLDDPGARLDIANGLWYADDLTFRQEYMERVKAYYRAAVEPLDFRNPGSAGVINEWVSQRTEGLVPNLIDSLDPETVMLLVNAVYFKGAWAEPFDPALTQPHPFHLASGTVKQVPMMYRDGQIDHYRTDTFQAIRLPYGDEKRLAMYVFLPAEGIALGDFVQSLNYEDWQTWVASFQPKLGQVRLPRMELSYKVQLNRALQGLGMASAFDPARAEFGEIRPVSTVQNMYISEVNHQAVLKVNEEGTEAAAATSIGFRVTSLPAYEFHFVADRPFLVAIRDEVTGTLLFIGSVADPDVS